MAELTCPVPTNPNAERIVREAWELFQRRGYRGVSVSELCRQCGISKPTLYYHFHDKETLFVHVVVRQLRGYREILAGDEPLQVRLTRLAASMLSSFETDIAVMMRDMTNIQEVANRETVNRAFQIELFGPLAEAIAAAEKAGDAPSLPNDFYAWAYLGLVNTFVGKSERLGIEPGLLAEQLVALFFQGALKRLPGMALE